MENKILYKIDMKKKTSWPLVIFLGLFLLAGVAMISTVAYGLISDGEKFKELYIAMLLLLVVLIIITDIFLWQIKGIESIIIDDEIRLIRRGKLFFMQRSISFNELETVKVSKDTDSPFWIKTCGLGGGNIVFDYLGRKARIGQDISISYAEIVVDEIDRVIREKLNNYA